MYTDRIKNIGQYKLNASADAPDFRDWQYQPALIKLKSSVSYLVEISISRHRSTCAANTATKICSGRRSTKPAIMVRLILTCHF